MALSIGTRLGVYEITAQIGAGAMGQVYRARDTKLGREVALKVLPDAFVTDPVWLARFEREARTLATLNHQNIAAIHGLEEGQARQAGQAGLAKTPPALPALHFIVMELVEGEDLSQRIARGPVPLDEAVPIARQIADALETAHAHHIIHRDLKPANIKVRADGTVKLLDFGIAKVLADAQPAGETVAGATVVGQVVGTGPYMSPEQARGQPVDKRTDVWAFGCVLYELLTGAPAFPGATYHASVSAVLEKEPDWGALPGVTPDAVRRLLRRCLAKDHRRRLADIADARLELEDHAATDHAGESSAPRTRSVWLGAALAAAVGAAVTAFVTLSGGRLPAVSPAAVTNLAILPPPGETLITGMRAVSISPDGSRLAIATSAGVYVRTMDALELRRLSVDANIGSGNMAFSPDGSHLAIMGLNGIQSIDLATGASTMLPVPATNPAGVLGSLTWNDRGLLGAFGGGGVWLLPKASSTWEPMIRLPGTEATSAAQLLPDGQHVLMTLLQLAERRRTGRVVVQELKSGTRTLIAEDGSDALAFADYVLYVKNGVLLAQPFDMKTATPTGEPVSIVEGVQSANSVNATVQYAVGASGTLAYVPGQAMPASLALDLVLSDRRGAVEHLNLPPAPYETPRVSPDGRMFAVSTDDGRDASVWVRDVAGTSSLRRLTIGGRNRFPVWSPNSKRLAFQSNRDGDLGIFAQAADGSDAAVRVTTAEAGTEHLPESWSATDLLYSVVRGGSFTLWSLSLGTNRSSPVAGITSSTPIAAAFSPDGRWFAYNTTAGTPSADAASPAGPSTTYVRPFPPTGAVYQLSRDDDSHHPVWSRDGRELFFIPAPRRLFTVKVQFTPSFSFAPPQLLPPAGQMGPGELPRNYDVLPDGLRFIGRQIAEDEQRRAGGAERIQVVTNLLEVIRRRR